MSDIVKLTSNGCQAGCREDEMNVQAGELALHLRLERKVCGADGAAVEAGFGS
jgi:hypothetical protein